MDNKELVKLAMEAREMAYAPYSHWKVGAALLTKDGKVYKGCNVENASYTPTNCAERTAIFKAVSEGVYDFEKIAIVGGEDGAEVLHICPPCGVCQQVMMEFCDYENFEIILGATDEKEIVSTTLKEINPYAFGPSDLLGK